MFTAALLTLAKTWKQCKCPSTEEWIKMWYIYIMEFYSAIKGMEWVIFRNMDGPRKSQAEWSKSEREKQTLYINAYMWNLEKWYACVLSHFSHVWLFVTPWTVALQSPLSMGILQARILEWVAILFSRGSSETRDWTWVSCIAGSFCTVWVVREAQKYGIDDLICKAEIEM